jgi:hypothetical protein
VSLPFSYDSQAFLPWNETGYVYTSKRNSGDVAVTLPRCAFYPGRIGQGAPSNAVFTQSDAEATFGFSDIAGLGANPKPGDTLTPPGKAPRVVLFVLESPMMQFWSVTTRDLVLAYDLRNSATILRAAVTPGGDMLRTADYTAVAQDQPCRLQPAGMTVEEETDGGHTTREAFTLFIDTALPLFAGDLVQVSGVKYTVTGQANRSQFDTLTTVSCERTR